MARLVPGGSAGSGNDMMMMMMMMIEVVAFASNFRHTKPGLPRHHPGSNSLGLGTISTFRATTASTGIIPEYEGMSTETPRFWHRTATHGPRT